MEYRWESNIRTTRKELHRNHKGVRGWSGGNTARKVRTYQIIILVRNIGDMRKNFKPKEELNDGWEKHRGIQIPRSMDMKRQGKNFRKV